MAKKKDFESNLINLEKIVSELENRDPALIRGIVRKI